MLDETLGSKIEKMVAFAPVMAETHLNGIFTKFVVKFGLDHYLFSRCKSVLVLEPESVTGWLVNAISPYVLRLFPRTTWTFVQGIVGVNDESHMDNQRMPMMAKNDVGGTSCTNMAHWFQIYRTGKFESFDRSNIGGAEARPYPTDNLSKALADAKILLLSGSKDAFS